ncbi:MAG: hypothetical protein ACPHAN_14630 [Pseudomonadales bacterium]
MRVDRRSILKGLIALPLIGSALDPLVRTAASKGLLAEEIKNSPLIYLSPIGREGAYSRCQAEIWYVEVADLLLVCTNSDSWRARAITLGRTLTQIWVGDVGVWKQGSSKHLALPGFEAEGTPITEQSMINHALEAFGDKYPLQWLLWKGRFKKGLKDGSRVMLGYKPLL